jgi:hypothetical protein
LPRRRCSPNQIARVVSDLFERLGAAESIGPSFGEDRFVAGVERLAARTSRLAMLGPKPKSMLDGT